MSTRWTLPSSFRRGLFYFFFVHAAKVPCCFLGFDFWFFFISFYFIRRPPLVPVSINNVYLSLPRCTPTSVRCTVNTRPWSLCCPWSGCTPLGKHLGICRECLLARNKGRDFCRLKRNVCRMKNTNGKKNGMPIRADDTLATGKSGGDDNVVGGCGMGVEGQCRILELVVSRQTRKGVSSPTHDSSIQSIGLISSGSTYSVGSHLLSFRISLSPRAKHR